MKNIDSNTKGLSSEEAEQSSTQFQNRIAKIIVVASGKGGVGKSFITGLLACLLNAKGYRVGILDADFSASCIPAYFGVCGPVSRGQYSFLPPQSKSGIKIISADFFLANDDQRIVWKESLISNVVKELWSEMEWGELDYLLVDMPPANSEAAVTILQSLPVFGAVMVTLPQGISGRIVNGSIKLFQRMNTPILGIVENMSCLVNQKTEEGLEIFGRFQAEPGSAFSQAVVLSQLPLDMDFCRLCDTGRIEDLPLDSFEGLIEAFQRSISEVEIDAANREAIQSDKQTQENGKVVDSAQSDSCTDGRLSAEEDHQQYFSETVVHLIKSRENVGTLDQPDGQGLFTGSCGDRMQIDLKIIAGRILDARFLADGCGVTYACGTMITKMAFARKLEDANRITPEELIDALDGLPEDHLHCAELAVMTLREAVIDALEGHKNRLN